MSAAAHLFTGKNALVTGGAAGIGWATACALADAGARVAICTRSGKTLEAAKDRIAVSGHDDMVCYQADVSSHSDMTELFSVLSERFGVLHCLVNNAGIDSFCDIENFSREQFARVMEVNVTSVFTAVAEALPLMRGAAGASVVNVGSIHGHVTTAGRADYVTSKTALIGATRALALDLADHGIRVNQVSPGAIETPMLHRAWQQKAPDIAFDELKRRAGLQHPVGRIGEPADVAEAILFLLSDRASFITGTDLLVDGGVHARLAISSIWES